MSTTTPRLNVLHISTWKERCGIAAYCEDMVNALTARGVSNEVRPLERKRTKYMTGPEMYNLMDELAHGAEKYDVVHIQHEFSFFAGCGDLDDGNRNFFKLIKLLRRKNVKTVVTFHTEPFMLPPLEGRRAKLKRMLQLKEPINAWYGPREFGYGRTNVRALVHAQKSRACFVKQGFDPSIVRLMPMGVNPRSESFYKYTRQEAKARLGIDPDCILMSLFGFIAGYKGHEVAVQALKKLPKHYSLAIVGGAHPEGGDHTIDRILTIWGKRTPERLRITGYVSNDTLNLYHAASDLCLAPYVDGNLASSAAITWALSSGRPVIASSIPSFRELNEQSQALEMSTPGCVAELAWTIQRLMDNPERIRELVRNAADYVARNTWEAAGNVVLGVYCELTGRQIESFMPMVGNTRVVPRPAVTVSKDPVPHIPDLQAAGSKSEAA